MYRRVQTTAKSDLAALARRQAILRQLEKLMRQRAAIDGSRIWKCPKCQRVMRSDRDHQPRCGETICSHCHRTMPIIDSRFCMVLCKHSGMGPSHLPLIDHLETDFLGRGSLVGEFLPGNMDRGLGQ